MTAPAYWMTPPWAYAPLEARAADGGYLMSVYLCRDYGQWFVIEKSATSGMTYLVLDDFGALVPTEQIQGIRFKESGNVVLDEDAWQLLELERAKFEVKADLREPKRVAAAHAEIRFEPDVSDRTMYVHIELDEDLAPLADRTVYCIGTPGHEAPIHLTHRQLAALLVAAQELVKPADAPIPVGEASESNWGELQEHLQ